jgi:hypothetical protein
MQCSEDVPVLRMPSACCAPRKILTLHPVYREARCPVTLVLIIIILLGQQPGWAIVTIHEGVSRMKNWIFRQPSADISKESHKRGFTAKYRPKIVITRTRQLCQSALQTRTHHFEFACLSSN